MLTSESESQDLLHLLLHESFPLVLEAVASTAETSPLFCNGNSVCSFLLTWLNTQHDHCLILFM